MDDLDKWTCKYCEENRSAHEQYDGYGIYCGRMCDPCFKRRFRRDIMERYETDEPLDPEPEVGSGSWYWCEQNSHGWYI